MPSNSLMISSVTCKAVTANVVCKGKYWVQNMVSPVRFSEAMTLCCRRSPREGIVKNLDRSAFQQPALSPLLILFRSHQLISISVSSALLYFWLLHAQPAQLSISDVLFLASACTASILALVSSQLNRAQLGSGHGMTVLPTCSTMPGNPSFSNPPSILGHNPVGLSRLKCGTCSISIPWEQIQPF